jgi:2-hydroxychromene-2-carboxylate isomerase
MTEPSLDFFYELASPYACLSALRIGALAPAHKVSIRWRPFSLGPIFQAEGMKDSPLNVFPLRGTYARRDVARRGLRYGFDVRFPSTFPRHTVLASRGGAGGAVRGVGRGL